MDNTDSNLFGRIFLIFWAIIPAVFSFVVFLILHRHSNKIRHHEKNLDEEKYHIKWGYRWNGKPYIKKQGYGKNYSKLSKDEYLLNLTDKKSESLK